MSHQFLDRLAPVIAGHVRVQVEPHTLDVVVVGAVGREEVEYDTAPKLGQERLGLLARVDDVVVEDEVDAPGAAVLGCQLLDQAAEQVTALARSLDPGELAGSGVQRPGNEVLLVLAGRDYETPVPRDHPVAPDLGVEMDIHLVLEEDRLGGAAVVGEVAQARQNALPALAIPRAEHDGLGCGQTRADGAEGPAHGAVGDPGKAPLGHLQREQLPGPGRPLPTEVGRDLEQNLPELGPVACIHLGLPVAGALVEESLLAPRPVPLPGSHNRSRGTAEVASDLLSRKPFCQFDDHEETEGGLRVLGLSSSVDQSTFLSSIEPGYCVHGKATSIVVFGLATATIDGLAFPFNFLPTNRGPSDDPDSCTVV